MPDHLILVAAARPERGNGPTRRLRREGKVPGVVYQRGADSLPFSVPARELRLLLANGGRTSVVELSVAGGEAVPVIFKERQLHPVWGNVIHIDFQQVDLAVAVEVAVGVALVGAALGVREGGILDQPARDVIVRALPDSLPDVIEFDVSDLDVGETVTIGDLVAPDGVEILGDPEQVIASVVLPRAAVEEEVAEEEEGEELAEGEEGEESGDGDDEEEEG